MKDDDNSRGRGPGKGGGAGSRGGGKGFGGKGPGSRGAGGRSFGGRDGESRGGERKGFREAGERRSFRGHSEGEERPARRFGKPTEGSAPRPRRADGERPARFKPEGEGRPFRERSGEERPRRSERGGERVFRERPSGGERAERPARGGFGRPPRRPEAGDGERRFERPRPQRGERDATRGERPRRPREEAPTEGKLIAAQEPERIAKVMARAGVASRRDSEAMIAEGRVSVNGTVLESPAFDVKPTDVVLVDGEPLPARERTRLWLYHKPRGLVTTNFDPEGRPTVFEALPEDLPRVLSIGRLDINTEGLLLLTNDGGLARVLELPETGWLRRYRVRAFGEVTQDRLDTVKDGVEIDGVHYGPVIARFERQQGFNTWLTVDLREGKNREVKTVLEHLGLAVNRLIRISFGPFQLGEIEEGEVEEIRSRVLQDQLGTELAARAGADFEAPRRDARPSAPRRAPAAEDRPRRRRETGDEAPDTKREAVRELRGDKSWNRGVWRDAETEPQRARKAPPRRGADPRVEREVREATGAVERKRDKAIADPKGRRVLVERISAPSREDSAEPETRRRPDRKPRNERGSGEARAPRAPVRSVGERPARRSRDEAGGRDRADERPWQDRSSRGERGERAPRDGAERPARRFSERPAGDKPRGRSFGDKPFGGRPSGGKPGGGGGRPGGRGPRPGGPRSKRD
ncbi:MAG: pseudouridine synthase [Bosea sp. (in: a-proteobacteria)]|uniref:pseudouridine synthase n=1 Tax=Bosea sp. (in: a-proteobacteria) TaxID=1871050 RepID=UPI003F7CB724